MSPRAKGTRVQAVLGVPPKSKCARLHDQISASSRLLLARALLSRLPLPPLAQAMRCVCIPLPMQAMLGVPTKPQGLHLDLSSTEATAGAAGACVCVCVTGQLISGTTFSGGGSYAP